MWKSLYGYLDEFKSDIDRAGVRGDHQSLANLLAHWQEFEMTRSKSDLAAFAKDLITDSSLASHVSRGINRRSPWVRDSAGLWMRLYAMHADGEVCV